MKWPWKSSAPSPETLALWQEALAIPLFSPLSAEERHRLVLLADKFLEQKKLVLLQGLVLNDVMEARIALLFALPVLGLGLDWLDGFHEILIYPSPFVVNDEWQDDAGLVHRGEMVHSGQSWDQGPIVLNWQEIQDSFDLSGFNLIIHETAHKLDGRNTGVVNGMPLIPCVRWPAGKISCARQWRICRTKWIWWEKTRPVWMLMPPAIRRNVLPCCRSIFSVRRNCFPTGFLNFIAALYSFTARIRWRGLTRSVPLRQPLPAI
ncbi:glucose-regulated metallopeptidase M90 [Sodalis ligni]|uniref:Glucose-regulated metallopeptidase M90 n=1 Tax=Sodalis ligni TaxID=2697027 RepID=A0A4R1N4V7_9GAMM|nr:glucose-regulated metallopeptidase M90 [Sodalis ligni]